MILSSHHTLINSHSVKIAVSLKFDARTFQLERRVLFHQLKEFHFYGFLIQIRVLCTPCCCCCQDVALIYCLILLFENVFHHQSLIHKTGNAIESTSRLNAFHCHFASTMYSDLSHQLSSTDDCRAKRQCAVILGTCRKWLLAPEPKNSNFSIYFPRQGIPCRYRVSRITNR